MMGSILPIIRSRTSGQQLVDRRHLRKPNSPVLVLLRHKFLWRDCLAIGAAQHGHRGSVLTRAAIIRRRMVAIEFGMWRSGRSGGSSGSVTVGYRRRRE